MPTYVVLHDLAVPGDPPVTNSKRFNSQIIKGGLGNTVVLPEAEAAPLVRLGILAVPGANEPVRLLRETAAAARQTAEDERHRAAEAEADAEAIREREREEAASSIPSKARRI